MFIDLAVDVGPVIYYYRWSCENMRHEAIILVVKDYQKDIKHGDTATNVFEHITL